MDIEFNAPKVATILLDESLREDTTILGTVVDTTPRIGMTHEEAIQLQEFTRLMWMDYERYGALRRLLSRVDAYLAKKEQA